MTRETASTSSNFRGDFDEIAITRVIEAPREHVWKAWTDPESFKAWWGPKRFTVTLCKMDLRVGGVYLTCMRSPDGTDYRGTGTYREIVPNTKIVMTDNFADESGNIVPASYYGKDTDSQAGMLMTVALRDSGGSTAIAICYSGLKAGNERDRTYIALNESLDKLDELSTQRQADLTG
jgi:uncharacterized protein YndB with AHSA1/START domain